MGMVNYKYQRYPKQLLPIAVVWCPSLLQYSGRTRDLRDLEVKVEPRIVEVLEGYVSRVEDEWAWVVLGTPRGQSLEGAFPRRRLAKVDLDHAGAAFQYVVKEGGEEVLAELIPVHTPPDAPWLEELRGFDLAGLRAYLDEQAEKEGIGVA